MSNNTKYEVLGYKEIEVENIEPHDDNPRPMFHLKSDDPNLLSLGDAIKMDGQHNPATVYEKVGGWRDENEPGQYRLYQGERRWRACQAVGVKKLRCLVVRAPLDKTEELEWLGNEEAHKQSWQQFFVLKHCYDLAIEMGVDVATQDMATKTGQSLGDLKNAKKLFSLTEEIQGLVVAYEQAKYETELDGSRKAQGRLRGSGVKVTELPVAKAAAIYDLFSAWRDNFPQLCRHLNDFELQHLIVKRSVKSGTIKDLQNFTAQVRQASDLDHLPEGQMKVFIDYFDEDTDLGQREFARVAGSRDRGHMNKSVKSFDATIRSVERLLTIDEGWKMSPDLTEEIFLKVVDLRDQLSDLRDHMRKLV